jgi:hypothetical protein
MSTTTKSAAPATIDHLLDRVREFLSGFSGDAFEMQEAEALMEDIDAKRNDLRAARELLAMPEPVAQPARWYMVNNIGMATLCTDEEDAIREAANADENYPMGRPHRARLLAEVTRST